MAKFTVYLQTTTSVTVHVEVEDDGRDEAELRESAIEKAFAEAPGSICAHCSGWGSSWSRDEGELEVATEADGSEVKPVRES